MVNANAGVGIASTTTLIIENYDDYNNNEINSTNFYWAAKNPGSWGENLKAVSYTHLTLPTIYSV